MFLLVFSTNQIKEKFTYNTYHLDPIRDEKLEPNKIIDVRITFRLVTNTHTQPLLPLLKLDFSVFFQTPLVLGGAAPRTPSTVLHRRYFSTPLTLHTPLRTWNGIALPLFK